MSSKFGKKGPVNGHELHGQERDPLAKSHQQLDKAPEQLRSDVRAEVDKSLGLKPSRPKRRDSSNSHKAVLDSFKPTKAEAEPLEPMTKIAVDHEMSDTKYPPIGMLIYLNSDVPGRILTVDQLASSFTPVQFSSLNRFNRFVREKGFDPSEEEAKQDKNPLLAFEYKGKWIVVGGRDALKLEENQAFLWKIWRKTELDK